MSEYATELGHRVVTDRRHRAAVDDPRNYPPNDNQPPVGSVGPNVAPGFGDTHVMYPAGDQRPETSLMPTPPVQAWQGWPTEWATPNWGDGVGIGRAAAKVSVVFGAIDLNSSLLATMPPYRVAHGEPAPLLPWMVNPQPEVYTGWIEAFKQVVASYMAGEAFLWATSRYKDGVDGAPGTVRNWVMVNPDWVEIKMLGQLRRFYLLGEDVTEDVRCAAVMAPCRAWARGVGPAEALASRLCSEPPPRSGT